ncbi:sensor histidine kinase [Mucilaginibacter jinjuensis]|uniref:histidine kinase n=1 Tax=Mucilaginibacter jinjuensis TaxID=1176721 RepID=A0ABY7TA26_9SPHI|nr:PAS domain-containing sensor histidine kinase [Mucilaginibacter jinjuensis]WCT13349.1 PAS domain-containing sensor histidine kinase [Mucilaginibacter jinjuensis]
MIDTILLAEQKQAMLAAIVATSDDAIISKTLEGVITSWNQSAERIFGYTAQEAIGKHISLIIPFERLAEETYIIGQISKGHRIHHFETFRCTKYGKLIPISVSVSPILDNEGGVIGASKIARDISDHTIARERQAILAAIVDTSDDCILSKTLDGIITSWNKSAERMFGYTEAEAIGKHITLIIPADRLAEEQYIISEVRKGNKVDHFETIRLAKDGRQIPISLSVSPIVDDKGTVIGASKIARDISTDLAIKEENKRLFEEVKALNEKKDEFIGLASHELKTPLASISGYLQILNTMVTEEKARKFLGKARGQVKKLSALVADLLDVSKIEAGKLQFKSELVDLKKIAEETIELVALTNRDYHIKLDTPASLMLVRGDAHRIEQVITNLLTNAIRYSPGQDQVEVTIKANLQNVTLAVRDQGIGIPADKLKDVFSRFYRIDNTNPYISGLGIGLFLAYEIIERHQGQIWAESELGKGSSFCFSLPLATTE